MQQILAKCRRAVAELKKGEGPLLGPRHQRRLDDCFRFIVSFEILAGLVYQARKVKHNAQLEFEDELSQAYRTLLNLQEAEEKPSALRAWVIEYRRIWRENLALFLVTVLLFCASIVVGWFCATQRPEYASLLFSQSIQEHIVQNTAWFDAINENPLLSGFEIAANNIAVSFNMFAAGCLFGLGSMILLIYNGIHIGSIFGFSYLYDFDRQLLEFILSHGPLELSIIVAAAFCGTLVGKTFLVWPLKDINQRASAAGRTAFTVLIGITPWLIIAAIFEAFVSPNPSFTFTTKIVSGGILAAVFWVWTLWPFKS